jgi:hypothetical protein
MHADPAHLSDVVRSASGYQRPGGDGLWLAGLLVVELHGPDGELKFRTEVPNLVTQVGDQMYGERGSGAASPSAPTGMRLGTGGATAAAKTGAGAAIVTYVTGSQKAFEATYPSSTLNGSSRRISYQCIWAAGVATATGIDEAVITNESSLTNVAGTAANTVARAVLSPVVNKGALDQLTITWTHDLLGA